jgi:hypothetical protein
MKPTGPQKGRWYRFNPPATSVAIPTQIPSVFRIERCVFDRGKFVDRLEDGRCKFVGWPMNDTRRAPALENSAVSEQTRKMHRRCHFTLLLNGRGVTAFLDPDQHSY